MALSRYEQMQRDMNNGVITTTSGPFAGMTPEQMQKAYQEETAMRERPIEAAFMGSVDGSGNLLDKYKLGEIEKLKKYDEVKADSRGLNEIRERALGKGPTSWEQMMNNRQGMEQQNQLDKSSRAASTQNAMGVNQLMRMGGAGGGSMERMAAGAAKDAMFNRNAINRQGMSDRLNIGLQGQQERNDLLKGLPGLDNQVAELKMKNNQFDSANNQFNISMAADRDKFNIGNTLKGVDAQNTQNQQAWQTKMKDWAANKQADATERSSK